jgi:protein involved in polysaccharide export with SLBB domain
MTVEDAILQCGGIMTSASVEKIEVARRIQDQLKYTSRTAEIFTFNITKGLESSPEASGFTLKPFDEIIVHSSPGYKVQTSVYIKGEILFEGEYVLASDGERLSDLIKKAGGLTPAAYIKGASLKRRYTEEERNKLESMMRIASEGSTKDTISLKTLRPDEYYSVGINLKSALEKSGGRNDVILVEGDQINVPKYKGVVKVSGAVLYPNALTVEQGKRLKSYLYKSGGYQNGARKRPYVVYMNGDVASTKSIMGIKKYPKVEPGSEIIVPMRTAKTGNIKGPEILAIASISVSLASVVAMLMSVLK